MQSKKQTSNNDVSSAGSEKWFLDYTRHPDGPAEIYPYVGEGFVFEKWVMAKVRAHRSREEDSPSPER